MNFRRFNSSVSKESGCSFKIYLLKRVGEYVLHDSTEYDDLLIFEDSLLDKDQYEEDGKKFKELSNNKDCF